MLAMLVLSMVASAAIIKATGKAKEKAQEKWSDVRGWAERKSAERERAKRQRADRWERKFDEALSEGPRNPLWWPYAIGWLIGGSVAAAGAGAVGAVSGAIAGGGSGYRLGRVAGERGRRFGETFREWQARNRGHGDVVDLGLCAQCERWLAASELTTVGAKQYCPDCIAASTVPPRGEENSGRSDQSQEASAEGPKRVVLCVRCRDFAPDPGSDLCCACQSDARATREPFEFRCSCGALTSRVGDLCSDCVRRNREQQEKDKAQQQAQAGESEEQSGPIRAYAERIYPQHSALEAGAHTDSATGTDGGDVDGVLDADVVDSDAEAQQQELAPVVPISQSKENNAMARIEGGIEGVTAKLDQFHAHFEQVRGALTATQDSLEAARWSGAPIERLEAARLKLGQVIEDLATASTSISSGGYSVRDALTAHRQVGSDESVRAQ